jgi:hypothetical protein
MLVTLRGNQKSKTIWSKPFSDLEWLVYLRRVVLVNEVNVNLIRYTSLTNLQDRTALKVNINNQDLNPKEALDINRYIQQVYTPHSALQNVVHIQVS